LEQTDKRTDNANELTINTDARLVITVVTSGQNNLTKGRVAPAHESFNRLQTENVSFKRFENTDGGAQ